MGRKGREGGGKGRRKGKKRKEGGRKGREKGREGKEGKGKVASWLLGGWTSLFHSMSNANTSRDDTVDTGTKLLRCHDGT